MTKYIDRYYLNGEVYGIRFGGEGGGGYQPNEHTLVWLPFKEDLLDHSGNNVQFIQGGTNLNIIDGVADFDGGYLYLTSGYGATSLPLTISFWVNLDSIPSSGEYCILNSNEYLGGYYGWNFIINNSSHYQNPSQLRLEVLPGGGLFNGTSCTVNTRYYVVGVLDSGDCKFYVNNILVGQNFDSPNLVNRLGIGTNNWQNSDIGLQLLDGKMSDIIIEDKARTAQEVEDYYNQTKSLYGIS